MNSAVVSAQMNIFVGQTGRTLTDKIHNDADIFFNVSPNAFVLYISTPFTNEDDFWLCLL